MKQRLWRMRIKVNGVEWTGPLVATWEVAGDPISDDHTTDEISAEDLFRRWSQYVLQHYPNGLVPIHWFIESPGRAKFEGAPFDFHSEGRHNFLTYYTWPVDEETGEPINWMEVPVVDKLWRRGRGDKGGFIQEYTGWKPSMLQPYVYLPSLEHGISPTDSFGLQAT